MFKKRGIFEQGFTLEDLEDMMPFERTIYLILIKQKLDEQEANKGK